MDSPTPASANSADRPAATHPSPLPRSRVVLFFALAAFGAAADLWSKAAVFSWRGIPGEKDVWWIVQEILGIQTAVNIGAVFGIGAGQGTLFAGLSIIAGIGIGIWLFWYKAAHSLWLTWALGMISGGIVGNLYDRLGLWWQPGYPEQWQSGVRDWILFRLQGVPMFDPWPNFNIADSLLVAGTCMLLYQSLFPGEESRRQEKAPESGEERGD